MTIKMRFEMNTETKIKVEESPFDDENSRPLLDLVIYQTGWDGVMTVELERMVVRMDRSQALAMAEALVYRTAANAMAEADTFLDDEVRDDHRRAADAAFEVESDA